MGPSRGIVFCALVARHIAFCLAAEEAVYAVVPKLTANTFFDDVRKGCEAEAARQPNATCRFVGPQELDAEEQARIIDALVEEGISGLAVSVIDVNITSRAINRAAEAGIPVVTFDSDAPDSQRFAHIGTNNFELGHSFAWLLSTLGQRDGGGNYAVISSEAPNLDHRIAGFRYKLEETFESQWKEIGPPTDCRDNGDVALEQMYELASDPEVDAIISVGGWPMWIEPATRWKDFVDSNRHVLLFVADAAPVQIDLINQGYGDALVGQKPFDIGELIIQTLAGHNEDELAPAGEEFIWTGERIFLKPDSGIDDGASAAFDGRSIITSQVLVVANVIVFFVVACWV